MDPSPAEGYSPPGIEEARPEVKKAEDDPDNPQNWPIYKKVYVSSVGLAFVFAVSVCSRVKFLRPSNA